MDHSHDDSTSLNKYISETGICSRREADRLIDAGRVTINNKPTRTGNRVSPGDIVRIDGKPLKAKPKTLYIAFNKPVGIVCTTDPKEPKNIISFIGHKQRLFPVGRLDKPSQGLIFLTNDGDIVNKILRAGNEHDKEYIVSVKPAITPEFIQRMGNGLPILGTVTKKCEVEALGSNTFRIVLSQGLNRQIRRMCEFLNYEVTKLNRVRIMNVQLGKLPLGKYRELTPAETRELQRLIAHSSKTEEASVDQNRKKGPTPTSKRTSRPTPPKRSVRPATPKRKKR